MMHPRIQRQITLQQLLQITLLEHLLLNNHLHHRPLEIIVRIRRPLHHRKTLLHLPLHFTRYQLLKHRQSRRRPILRRRSTTTTAPASAF
ncbi:hypothetical protein HanRHA438_Chr16g0785791 [Helianthus annuus]|nr:hypothetical protein HanPSC8_Chr16g0743511 [Helianthus annuus]KAJ0838143.1 hypothetical protein HanRHA438_Chr16g0785791 [Helianthus annuus]